MNEAVLSKAPSLDSLNSMLPELSMMGGWNKKEASLWPKPRTRFLPHIWRWADAKAGLDTAGRYISTEQAERRNLFLVNPLPGNYYATLPTLVSAYQMILPGERARSHRHTPAALRLVLDVGDNVFTVVDGERLDMKSRDVVLTPGWCWHGHANDGKHAAYWVDYLDVPLVQLLEPMFFEEYADGFQKPESTPRQSPFVFAWAETEAALAKAPEDPSGRHGARVELKKPKQTMHTIGIHMEKLKAKRTTTPYRTTASQIFTIVEGSGTSKVGDKSISWNKGDVIAAPAWHQVSHHPQTDAVLFTVSDEVALRSLGLLRESVEAAG
jgi:gentisate 1,2-dioxygenase